MTSFADAGPQFDPTALIPHGTIAMGILNVRPYNADQGLIATPSKSSAAQYINIDIVITEGTFARKHIFDMIGVAGKEGYVNAGRASIKAILEFSGASPQNMAGYDIAQTGPDPVHGVDWMALDGKPVAFKVKVEKGTGGFDDKNKVSAFLSPVDPTLAKDWKRFLDKDWDVAAVTPAAAAPQQAAAPAWATPSQGAQAAAPAAPAWLPQSGTAPAAQTDDIPF